MKIYNSSVKVVCEDGARLSRVPQDARKGRSKSIYSNRNQLDGITVPKLPRGLLRLHMHEGAELHLRETRTRFPQ